MALVPTLAQQILEEMDVEGVTQELQTKSRASKSPVRYSPPAPSESSLASSIELLPDPDVRSESGSVSVSSFSGSVRDLNLGDSSQSWVETSSLEQQRSVRLDRSPEQSHRQQPLRTSESPLGARSSESVMTFNSGLSSTNEGSSRVRNRLARFFVSSRRSPLNTVGRR